MKKKTRIVMGTLIIILIIIGIFTTLNYIKKSKLGIIPYSAYTIKEDSVNINDQTFNIIFETKRAKIGYNGQIFKVCNENQISTLTNINHNLYDSTQKTPVKCCTFGDCNEGTDMDCVIDWQNEAGRCVKASMIRCTNIIHCPGEGDWVPDWSVHLAKKYYCKSQDEVGYCTVKQEKAFECWEGEGCPERTECINNFCEVKW